MILTIITPSGRDDLAVPICYAEDYMTTISFRPRDGVLWDDLKRQAVKAGVESVFRDDLRILYADGEVASAALDPVQGLEWMVKSDDDKHRALLVLSRPGYGDSEMQVVGVMSSLSGDVIFARRGADCDWECIYLPQDSHWNIRAQEVGSDD